MSILRIDLAARHARTAPARTQPGADTASGGGYVRPAERFFRAPRQYRPRANITGGRYRIWRWLCPSGGRSFRMSAAEGGDLSRDSGRPGAKTLAPGLAQNRYTGRGAWFRSRAARGAQQRAPRPGAANRPHAAPTAYGAQQRPQDTRDNRPDAVVDDTRDSARLVSLPRGAQWSTIRAPA